MSGRNNRIVRNRERNNVFSEKNKKIIAVIGIVIIIIVAVFVINCMKGKKQRTEILEPKLEVETAYEYFLLYSDEYVGVIDKTGNEVIGTKYTRYLYSKSGKRCLYML